VLRRSNSSRKRTTVLSYLSSTNLPLSSKTSFTLDIEYDEGMDGAPNSANINLSCCAALMPAKKTLGVRYNCRRFEIVLFQEVI
jgi:hypothetical protein